MSAEEVEFALSTGTIAGKWWNKGQGPLLLALHGWMDNANSFDLLAHELGDQQQLLALDLAGHGHSSHRANYGLWEHAFDMAELIKDHLDSKVYMVGHSLGGIVSLFIPHLLPEKCLGLLTIDSLGPLVEDSTLWSERLKNSWSYHEKLRNKSGAPFVYPNFESAVKKRALSKISPLDETRAAKLMERNLIQTSNGWQLRSDRKLAIPSPVRLTEEHAKALMTNFSHPIEVIVAESGLGLHTYKQRFAYYQNSVVHNLPGDHHLHMTPTPAKKIAQLLKGTPLLFR